MTRSTEERTSNLFQTCFVDASNSNRFKEALEFSSKISKVDEVMLESLISGSVDIRMERFVTDSTLFNLLNGPANIRVMQSVDENITRAAAVQPVRRRRRRSRLTDLDNNNNNDNSSITKSFKDWQGSNKWDRRITSLTLPRPLCPEIIHLGRRNATIQISSKFLPKLSDTTNFCFNISICSHSLNLNLSNRIREIEYQKPIVNGNGDKYHDYDMNRDNKYKYDDSSDRNSSVDDNDYNSNDNNSRTNIDNNDNNNNYYIDNNNDNNNSDESVTLNNCNILIIKLSNPNLKRSYQPEDTQENDLQL